MSKLQKLARKRNLDLGRVTFYRNGLTNLRDIGIFTPAELAEINHVIVHLSTVIRHKKREWAVIKRSKTYLKSLINKL